MQTTIPRAGALAAACVILMCCVHTDEVNTVANRDPVIQSLSGAANENEYAGTIVWQLWHKDIIYDVLTRYDFTYNASGTDAFLEQVDYANARVRGVDRETQLLYPQREHLMSIPCVTKWSTLTATECGHRATYLPSLHQPHHRTPLPVRRRPAALGNLQLHPAAHL